MQQYEACNSFWICFRQARGRPRKVTPVTLIYRDDGRGQGVEFVIRFPVAVQKEAA